MLDAITKPKSLPKVLDKSGIVHTNDYSHEGKFLDVNATYVMLDKGDEGYVMLPWRIITSVVVEVQDNI